MPQVVTRTDPASGLAAERHGWWAGEGLGWHWEVPKGMVTRFWLPVAGLLAGLIVADHFTTSRASLWQFLVLYHTPIGMYASFPFARTIGLSPLFVTLLVLHLHVLIGLFIVWNLEWLKALPKIGPRMIRMEERGRRAWDKRPRLRHLGFLGIPWFPTLVAVVLGGMARIVAMVILFYGGMSLLPI
jgi:hypothetical protein